MPTLRDLYRENLNYFPEYHTHLLNYINYMVRPFAISELTIYIEPNYITNMSDICLETPWGKFRMDVASADVLGGGHDWLAQTVAVKFSEWIKSNYILPEDNIELGEN